MEHYIVHDDILRNRAGFHDHASFRPTYEKRACAAVEVIHSIFCVESIYIFSNIPAAVYNAVLWNNAQRLLRQSYLRLYNSYLRTDRADVSSIDGKFELHLFQKKVTDECLDRGMH